MMRLLLTSALLLAGAALQARDPLVEVVRGTRWEQGTTGATPLQATQDPFFFQIRATGLGDFDPITDARAIPPGGTALPLPSRGDGEYSVTRGFPNQAARDATFPPGRYDFQATLAILGPTRAHVQLADAPVPPAPRFENLTEAQSIDPDQDFTLHWAAFPGATGDDSVDLEIRDAGDRSVVSFFDDLDPATTEWTFGPGELPSNRSLVVRLAFKRPGTPTAPDSGELLGGRSVALAETLASLRTTASGSVPTDSTAPQLKASMPGLGDTQSNRTDALLLTFSEPMNREGVSVQWQAAVNGSPVVLQPGLFQYFWTDDGLSLACTYDLLGTGWPAGAAVAWTLNGVAGDAKAFRDLAGNPLPLTSGMFLAAGGIDPCSTTNPGGTPIAAFFVSKHVHYRQTNAEPAVADPELGADATAIFNAPSFATSVGPVTLRVPTSNPFEFRMKVLTPPRDARDFSFRTFSEHFAGRSDLDDAYLGGAYRIELRNSEAVVTNSADLSLPDSGYPPTPHFANQQAAQAIAADREFALRWDPFPGANATNAFVSIEVVDPDSNTVFLAPDPCHGVELPPNATQVLLPPGTLRKGTRYTAILTLGRITDRGRTLPGVPGTGFAFLEKTTRAPIRTVDDAVPNPATAPRFEGITLASPGMIGLQIRCTPGRTLVLEQSAGAGAGFTTLVSTNPPVTPLRLEIPMNTPTGLLRARAL